MKKYTMNKENVYSIEALKGVYRKTLIYNESVMLCYFLLEKGAKIPLHSHKEHQIGYIPLKEKLSLQQ